MNLILIRGIPGSGKTTLATKIMESVLENCTHYEADMYFMDNDGNYNWERSKIREAHQWCQDKTDYDLERGYTVIVSNTFTTIKELKPYMSLAEKYCITPTIITCHNNWGSIHNVPPDTIIAMQNRFEYDLTSLVNEHMKRLETRF